MSKSSSRKFQDEFLKYLSNQKPSSWNLFIVLFAKWQTTCFKTFLSLIHYIRWKPTITFINHTNIYYIESYISWIISNSNLYHIINVKFHSCFSISNVETSVMLIWFGASISLLIEMNWPRIEWLTSVVMFAVVLLLILNVWITCYSIKKQLWLLFDRNT